MVEKKKPSMSTMVLARWCLLGILALFFVLMATNFLTGCGGSSEEDETEVHDTWVDKPVLTLDVVGQNIPSTFPRLPIFSIAGETSCNRRPTRLTRMMIIVELHNGAQPPENFHMIIDGNAVHSETDRRFAVVHLNEPGLVRLYELYPKDAILEDSRDWFVITVIEDGDVPPEGKIIYRIMEIDCEYCDTQMTRSSRLVARVE